MSKKILIITGQTATGKTGLAVDICKKINGEIVNADSRQVYKYMNIGTGKDVGRAKFKLINKVGDKEVGYYKIDGVAVWLLNAVEPNKQFDLSDFINLASLVIDDIKRRGKRVVVVGGTGYYISGFLNPPQTLGVKPNMYLRKILKILPTDFIIGIYKVLDGKNYRRLNKSEQRNRHRLIRKIEIKLAGKKLPSKLKPGYESKIICLTAKKDVISRKIIKRVLERLKQGLLEEIRFLKNKYGFEAPGLNCLAYKEFRSYFEGNENLDNCVKKWIKDEINYAKRQKTWFKSKNYKFTDITKINKKKMIDSLYRWYNEA